MREKRRELRINLLCYTVRRAPGISVYSWGQWISQGLYCDILISKNNLLCKHLISHLVRNFSTMRDSKFKSLDNYVSSCMK